jgi:hypothetical protein
MCHVKEPSLLKAMSAKHSLNLQPFTSNVDVATRVKDFQLGEKETNKPLAKQ